MKYVLTLFFTSGLIHPYHLDESIPNFMGLHWMFTFSLHFKNRILRANSADPDQTPHLVASELGLQC